MSHGPDDAVEELIRLQELNAARAGVKGPLTGSCDPEDVPCGIN